MADEPKATDTAAKAAAKAEASKPQKASPPKAGGNAPKLTPDKQLLALGKRDDVHTAAIAGLELRMEKIEAYKPARFVTLDELEFQVGAVRDFWKDARKRIKKQRARIAPLAVAPLRPRNPLIRPNPELVAESVRLRQLLAEIDVLHSLAQRERSWVKNLKRQVRIASEDEYVAISERLESRTDQTERLIIRRLVGMAALAESINPRLARPDFEDVARNLTKLRKRLKDARRPGDPPPELFSELLPAAGDDQ